MSKTTTIAALLRGATPGRTQSVGLMEVVPLLSELSDERFASPADAGVRMSTASYGTMVFDNACAAEEGPQLLIVPCHAGFVVKQAAQDHAMAEVGLVPPGQRGRFDTAMCIQQSQGGLISAGSHRMTILPHQLRERALAVRGQRSYDKLWPAISRFNAAFGVKGAAHLSSYFDRFARELDQFVAEFECVPGQVGAIVLIDGDVVGVERGPSHGYWAGVWPALIRGCYGSLALETARAKAAAGAELVSGRAPLPPAASLDALADAIEAAAEAEAERTRELIRQLVAKRLTVEAARSEHDLTIETLKGGLVGQLIREDERVVYVSLTTTARSRRGAAWRRAADFVI